MFYCSIKLGKQKSSSLILLISEELEGKGILPIAKNWRAILGELSYTACATDEAVAASAWHHPHARQ